MITLKNDEEFNPEWSVSPGDVLMTVLEDRDIRQSELAERTGLTTKHINQIIKKGVGISGDVAVVLERALDIPAQFWTRLDADYQAHLGRTKALAQVPDFALWADKFDKASLYRHGISHPKDDAPLRVEKILKFFCVASPDAFERTWLQPRVSFRRSQVFTVEEQNTALWLRLVERGAEQATVAPLHMRTLREVAKAIPAMTNLSVTDGFLAARSALAEAGVVLTFVREIPRTRVNAATWWLASDRPVIGLTERQRKPDVFWFNLVHEIGHILLHPKRTTFLDIDESKSADLVSEREANEFAENILLPKGALDQIAKATSREELALLSARLGIGVSIVAGQFGHSTNQWKVASPLRGTITDLDVDELEKL